MVGIPSFGNAETIGYVVRAATAGMVQYFPDLKPILVNSDGGSPDDTPRVAVSTESPDYIEKIILVSPRHKLQRISVHLPGHQRQGHRGARPVRGRARAEGQGLRHGRLGPAQHRAGVDRAAGRADPQGRLRLRGADVRALQVRRHHHQQHRLPPDPGAVRGAHPAAHRRRVRVSRRPGAALPGAGHVRRADGALRDRHLDDALRHQRGLRRLPGTPGRQDPRRQGSGLRPGTDVPAGGRHPLPAGRRLRGPMAPGARLARHPGVRLRAGHRPGDDRRQPRQAD